MCRKIKEMINIIMTKDEKSLQDFIRELSKSILSYLLNKFRFLGLVIILKISTKRYLYKGSPIQVKGINL